MQGHLENKQEKGRFNFKKETYLLQIKGKSERNRKNHLHGKKKEKNRELLQSGEIYCTVPFLP